MAVAQASEGTLSGSALLGLAGQVRRDRLGLMSALAREHGDAVRFRMGHRTLFFFNHPDYARHVLHVNGSNYRKGVGLIQARRALGDGPLTSEGDLWRRQRSLIAPPLHRDHVSSLTAVVWEEAGAMLARWRSQPAADQVDLVGEMTRLTIGVLERGLLGGELGSRDELAAVFDVIQDQAMFEMVTFGLVPSWLPSPRNRRFRTARTRLNSLIGTLLAGSRGGGEHDGALAWLPGDVAAEDWVRESLTTLLLAGHETTASTLGWICHELSQSPSVAARVRDEAREVLGHPLRAAAPAAADLKGLAYTTSVVEEALRLHPPVWLLSRRAIGPDKIGPYVVPAGADVLICPYTLHRHPGFWPDPDRLDPDRFLPARAGERHRYAYLPFGAGQRVCPGSHLGMLEATLVTAMLAGEFTVRIPPGREPRPSAMLTLKIQGGLPAWLSRWPDGE